MPGANLSSERVEHAAEGSSDLGLTLLNALGDAVIATDLNGLIIFWNTAAEQLYGWAAAEAVGRNVLDVTPSSQSRTTAASIFSQLIEGKTWSGEFETRHKDGHPFLVEVTDYPVRDPRGRLTAIVGISRAVAEVGRNTLVQEAIEASALYRLSDSLSRARSLDEVYDAALQVICETLHCQRASILLCDAAGVMRFVASRGLSEEYRKALEGHSPWKAGARDPQPILVSDVESCDEPEWVKATIRQEGIRSLAFIPLLIHDELVGKFMTYYEAPHIFIDHELQLAVTIARQVSFSLERYRAEDARQRAEKELRESEERFRLMSEHAPVMIWMSDERGGCLHLNRMLREFWGVDEDKVTQFDWRDTMHPEDAPEITRQIIEAIAGQCSVTIKGRYRRADGPYRVLQTDARPRVSATGEFLGMIGVNSDITERELAVAALRDSEERFRMAVEAAPSGMLMADAAGRITMVNAHAERLFGYHRSEMIGQAVEGFVPERFRAAHPKYREGYNAAPSVRPMGHGRDLFALRKDGTEIPVEIGLSPIDTPDGRMALAAVVDISSRKQAEAQRELLVGELNHRMKNTLAVVQAIANLTFRGAAASSDAREAFQGRLLSLARAHDLLTRAQWENASLNGLATDTVQALGVTGQRVSISGPSILLPPPQALAIGLGLHELLTNAMKYGALSNEVGRVDLTWGYSSDRREQFEIVWREQGGPPVSEPEHRGFGSTLLERMLKDQVGGQVEMAFHTEGLVCRIVGTAVAASGDTRQ